MFLIAAAILIVTGLIWVLSADATLASWNQPKSTEKSTKEDEMEALKKSTENVRNARNLDDGAECVRKN